MADDVDILSDGKRDALLTELEEWSLSQDGKSIERTLQFEDFSEAWGFMNRVALLRKRWTTIPSGSTSTTRSRSR